MRYLLSLLSLLFIISVRCELLLSPDTGYGCLTELVNDKGIAEFSGNDCPAIADTLGCADFSLRLRASVNNPRRPVIIRFNTTGEPVDITFSASMHSDFNEFAPDGITVKAERGASTLLENTRTKHMSITGEPRLYIVERHNGVWSTGVSCSRKAVTDTFTIIPEASITGIALCTEPDTRMKIMRLQIEDEHMQRPPVYNLDSLPGRSYPLEGKWTLYDYNLKQRNVSLGGTYTLTIASDGSGGYDMLYTDGAIVNTMPWLPGTLKGRLLPTPFADTYNVKWNDAHGDEIHSDAKASVDNVLTPQFLTIYIPDAGVEMRLRRHKNQPE